MQFVHRILSKCAIALAAVLLLILSMQVGIASAATKAVDTPHLAAKSLSELGELRNFNANDVLLRQLQREGKLSRSVNVLDSLGQTTIVQFPLVPSGVKKAFPNASGLVTIVRGDRNNSLSDTVTVDVQNMPPNITFTIFFIEFAGKPRSEEHTSELQSR